MDNKVFSETELAARKEINEENYCKVINIEAQTFINMVRRDILPAVSSYKKTLSDTIRDTKSVACWDALPYEEETLALLNKYSAAAFHTLRTLENAVSSPDKPKKNGALAAYCGEIIVPLMAELRCEVDALEPVMPREVWPYPAYGDLLFYTK